MRAERADGRVFGHNTDAEGYAAGLDASVGADWVEGVARALVLGAGGSARAVVAALLDRGVGRVQIAARNPDAVARLSPREKDIISLRFGLGGRKELTQKEVADRMGISQSYISRLEKRIISRLRRDIQKMS